MKQKKLTALLLVFAMLFGLMPVDMFTKVVHADGNQISVKMYNESMLARDFVLQHLLHESIKDKIGHGVEIENVEIKYGGTKNLQIGSFKGAKGTGVNNILEFDKGVALSTGDLKEDLGYYENIISHDPVSKSIPGKTYAIDYLKNEVLRDPASISFDIVLGDGAFVAKDNGKKEMTIEYAIGSEEYTKYSDSKFNDRFGIIVDGEVNYATVPNTEDEIAIRTVNQVKNKEFFRCNTTQGGNESLGLHVNLNGLTRSFTTKIKLDEGRHRLKFLIGDFYDSAYDSVLFIKMGSMDFKTFDPGKLSIEKVMGSSGNITGIKVKRTKTIDGATGTDGTISFELEEEGLDGVKTKHTYTIDGGVSEKTISIASDGEDDPEKIAFDTAKVQIKEPKMGATIDTTKDKLTLKIPAPVLKKDKASKTITVEAEEGATVTLYKKGSPNEQLNNALTNGGTYTSQSGLDAGDYFAVAEKTIDGHEFTSASSNIIKVLKPPVIKSNVDGAFDEVTIAKNGAFDIADLNVKAYKSDETTNIDMQSVDNPLSNDSSTPGIYTIKWTAEDSGFSTVKTKVVKIKPDKPQLTLGDYKGSFINIKGEADATVEIKNNENKIIATVVLDNNGDGKLLNPPNSTYTATQILNGVESDVFESLEIDRTKEAPVIYLLPNENVIEMTYGEADSTYTEPGAYARDTEEDKKDNGEVIVDEKNTFLTPKITINNPMFNENRETLKSLLSAPYFKQDGTATHTTAFTPFVGKYEVKYNVADTDNMAAETKIRLVKVYPPKPTLNAADGVNQNNSSITMDAIASASLYLYKDGKPVRIVNGQAVEITNQAELFKDGHTSIKIPKLPKGSNDSLATIKKGILSGVPDGTYTFVQRLYGLNSAQSDSITVKHKTSVPKITLRGNVIEKIIQGQSFNDQGAFYTIQDGTNAEREIIKDGANTDIEGGVDENTAVGKHIIRYTARNTTNENTETVTVERTVIVRPKTPTVIIGDYLDTTGDGSPDTFIDNPNGNDIKVENIENNATVQLVKGSNGNGALYEKIDDVVDKTKCYFTNLAKTNAILDQYGVFQTINDIQSEKSTLFDITKTNTSPVVTLSNIEVLEVEKDGTLVFNEAIASATDNEDDNAKLTEKIRIYSLLGNDNMPSGTAKTEINLQAADTANVGIKEYYYSVTDSDGNSDFKIKYVHVLPKAPTLTVVGKEKITVETTENDAVIELFKQDENGKWVLFESKKLDNAGSVDFTPLDTGAYKAVQLVKGLTSADSETKDFANPAYLITQVVDKDNNAIADVNFDVIELDGSKKKAKTDVNGKLILGVESANKLYELNLSDKGIFVMASSGENIDTLSTKTSVAGILASNEAASDIDKDKMLAKVQKKNGNKWEESHLARVKYKNGGYQLLGIENQKDYKVNLMYDLGEKGELAIAEFETRVNAINNIKIQNKPLNYGRVTDKAGNSISGVKVEVFHPDRDNKPDYDLGPIELPQVNGIKGSNKNGSLTDDKGEYGYSVYDKIPYVLVFTKAGYKDQYKLVEDVKGNLLGIDIQMEKGAKKIQNTGDKDLTEKDDNKDNKQDDSSGSASGGAGGAQAGGSGSKADKNNKTDASSKPKKGDDLAVIKDVKHSSLTDNTSKNGKNYDSDDKVDADSYIGFKSDNKDGDDKIVEEPRKGKVFTNPESGDIVYIPAKTEEGKDSFTVETKDKNGKTVKVKKNIAISSKPNMIYGKRKSLVLEINSDNRKGFDGSTFDFTVDYKNNLGRELKNATIAVKIPEGFELVGDDHKVKNGHIIVPVKNLRKDGESSMDFKLLAKSPKAEISSVKALIQEDGSGKIHPEAVSSIDVNVFELDKVYRVKPYVKGYPYGNFDQAASITRAEVAAMLTRCLKNEGKAFTNSKESNFKDVDAKAWYAGYVDQAVKYGLFGGFGDGTFKPNKKITRAELARVIGNYLKLDISEAGVIKQPYHDVKNHWARDDINALQRYGISIGYKDGTFKPNKEISRQETVKMINNMLYRYELPKVEPSFKDLASDHWSYGDIESAYRGYSFSMDSGRKFNIKASK